MKDIQIVADQVVKQMLENGEITSIEADYKTDITDQYERTAGVRNIVRIVPYLFSLHVNIRFEYQLPSIPAGFHLINDPQGDLLLSNGNERVNITDWVRSIVKYENGWIANAISKELPEEHQEEVKDRSDELIIQVKEMRKDRNNGKIVCILEASL